MSDPRIWLDAAGQMFFTLGLGFGALLAFASYMPTKNNCMRDAYIVVLINCSTSIIAGIVVFSILGHRELETGKPVTEVRRVFQFYSFQLHINLSKKFTVLISMFVIHKH